MIKSGDKLYCYKSYESQFCNFIENKIYIVDKVFYNTNGHGNSIDVISESGLSFVFDISSGYRLFLVTLESYFLTMAEYRDKQINEILND